MTQQTQMTGLQSQIVELNRYARNTSSLNIDWANREFQRTFVEAVKACAEPPANTMCVTVEWSSSNPATLFVRQGSLLSDSGKYIGELELGGDLGFALRQDLQELAVVKAAKEIEQERENALRAEAAQRVHHMMVCAIHAVG